MPSPWTAIPAARSSAPVLKIKLWTVLGLLVACALTGPTALVVASAAGRNVPAPPSYQTTDSTAVAAQVAADFLAGRTTAVPVAEGVSPDFATGPDGLEVVELTLVGSRSHGDASRSWTVSRFLAQVRAGAGEDDSAVRFLWVDVTTARASNGTPVLVAVPALTPVLPPDTPPDPLDGRDDPTRTTSIPEPVVETVRVWATAFAENRSDELRRLTGDPDAGTYVGLGGFTVQGDPLTPFAVQSPDGTAMILRVQVVLVADGANGYGVMNEYDVLVRRWSTQTPEIVAWGPAGTGGSLVAYQNKVDSTGPSMSGK